MKSIISTTFFSVFSCFVMIIGASSCKLDEAPKAEITILDPDEERVSDATVILFCTPDERTTCNIGDTAETNSDGVSEHEVEYESVLQVYAYKEVVIDSIPFMLSGESYIKMIPGETAKIVVDLELN
jgi:hypothetical protein